MRIPSHRDRGENRENMSMTPMIDVVFLLLIFFVCASLGQIPEAVLPTELAAGAVEAADPLERENPRDEYWLYLKQSDDGRIVYEINNARFDRVEVLEKTLNLLAELASQDPLVLDIAGEVPIGDMIHVYDAARRAGFESIHFAADPDKTGTALPPPKPVARE